ncbi:MAG: phosphoribosylformylglycinamidine synthase subunit PurS [Firmicutes bacterium]|nr:phosphoribosylformylglycinamidine synthase subunit PurS [Bacillota bacterium]
MSGERPGPAGGGGAAPASRLWRVVVEAMPRPEVRDPQGDVLRSFLAAAHPALESVRVGRRIELVLRAADRPAALAEAQAACDELLVHPLLETARLEAEELAPAAPAGG